MPSGNVEKLRALYEDWAKGDFRAADIFAPDFAFEPRSPDQAEGVLSGDAVGAHMREFLAQWERFRIEPQEFAEFDDVILVTERQYGTGKASGVRTEQTFFAAWTFRDGLVIRVLWEADRASALQAAGLSESPD
jgi:ketosteroid isomerase-like protein